VPRLLLQHGRPEQGVEIGDVLADEVHLLHRRVIHIAVVVHADFAQVVLERGQVADRGVQPDVEIFARSVRDFDAEVGGVARNVPVAQAALAVLVLLEPFLDLVQHFGLQVAGLAGPVFQEFDATRVAQLEKVMLRGFEHRGGTGQGRVGGFQFGGRVHRTAAFARVAVLVLGAALGAFALDEAVGQEHALVGVEELLDGLGADQAVGLEVTVDLLRQFVVFRGVGAVPVVKLDMKAVQVLRPAGRDVGHELLRGDARLLCRDHDGRAMRVVGPDEMHLVPVHALHPHPDVGLDVFHDVANVEVAVGVGQGSGDKKAALAHGVRVPSG